MAFFGRRQRNSHYRVARKAHDAQNERAGFRRRLWFAGFCMLIGFGALTARFYYLQVVSHQKYQTQAENNRIAVFPIPPSRGTISDRNGIPLAQNYSAYTLEIAPRKVEDLETTLTQLADIIEITPRDLRRFRRSLEDARNFETLPLRTKLTDEEVARFAVYKYRFPGVEIRARLYRQYPYQESASHVLGYIGRINDRDIERLQESGDLLNYRGTNHIGKTGVELSYESELHGIVGFEEVEVDALGRSVRTLSRIPPVVGDSLQLTIDMPLQRLAEEALGEMNGSVVAIVPSTGEILAMASMPGFDPGLFVEGIDTVNWDRLNTSPDKPLLNRAIRGLYPPGSTIKPFLSLAALTSGKRTAAQAIDDMGYFEISGGPGGKKYRFRDDKIGGHGRVDMHKAIVESCDTYYYILANETDIDDTARFLAQFGFGQETEVDIKNESKGVLPSRAWKRERFAGSRYREEHRRWYLGDSISAGIGQGYNSFTPLQLAHATAILANDGKVYRPHLVKRIVDGASGEAREIAPHLVKELSFKKEHLEVIRNAMVDVNLKGTGARIFKGASYTSAGKTGTSQVFSLRGERYVESRVKKHLRDHALFIVYAPVEKPEIAISVLVENGGFGARAAAPVARKLLDYYFTGRQPNEQSALDEVVKDETGWDE